MLTRGENNKLLFLKVLPCSPQFLILPLWRKGSQFLNVTLNNSQVPIQTRKPFLLAVNIALLAFKRLTVNVPLMEVIGENIHSSCLSKTKFQTLKIIHKLHPSSTKSTFFINVCPAAEKRSTKREFCTSECNFGRCLLDLINSDFWSLIRLR